MNQIMTVDRMVNRCILYKHKKYSLWLVIDLSKHKDAHHILWYSFSIEEQSFITHMYVQKNKRIGTNQIMTIDGIINIQILYKHNKHSIWLVKDLSKYNDAYW